VNQLALLCFVLEYSVNLKFFDSKAQLMVVKSRFGLHLAQKVLVLNKKKTINTNRKYLLKCSILNSRFFIAVLKLGYYANKKDFAVCFDISSENHLLS